jgi:transposase-like protein
LATLHKAFAEWLENNVEESMTYFDFNERWWRRIRTSNCIERLIASLLLEQHKEWMEEMEKSTFLCMNSGRKELVKSKVIILNE